MAEEKKRGLFKRLFGGKGEETATPEEQLEERVIEQAEAPTETAPEETIPEPVEAETAEPESPAPVDEAPAEEALAEAAPDVEEPAAEPEAEPAPAEEPAEEPKAEKVSWFQRLKKGLGRSSHALTDGISSIFRKRKLDDETLEELEDILIQSDLGVETAMAITERLADGRYDKEISDEEVRKVLAEEVEAVLEPVAQPLTVDAGHAPHVILVVGVNGTGKTTTIGKLAAKFRAQGHKVMLAAGDTFRAAAIEQLKIWGDRVGAPVISRDAGSDAAGLVFDAMREAKETPTDVLLIDTAGRLQNKAELMAELEKVVRVIRKHDETAPHSVLLTLDATTGQNALNQVEIFRDKAGVTGLAMTKLDGTARGGILVAIAAKHKLPVHFIGVGEGVDDLEPFDAGDFAKAIAGFAE
ncbi:MAG: signal recognition particle-docking protein FtsY [Hyphomicrobiales bacterium]|nr:MAG: signal recognition particle-docking protein FtsY [Hyphomicrobiales bacterium]